MNILFTGASSFTGYWFVRSLAEAGHNVTALFTRADKAAYVEEIRHARIRRLQEMCHAEFNCRFGDEQFLRMIENSAPDVLCHHAADVTNYKSPDFDYCRALANNTKHIQQVLHALAEVGCKRIVLTGTVFEGGEGAGSDGLPHISAYGLSKSLTAAVFRHFCQVHEFALGKFVIPNPIGPYEEPRFTAYLMRCWQAGSTACVQTPDYIRDNIHASLLANHYLQFVAGLPGSPGFRQTNPSGYIESQGAFAKRFAREMGTRLRIECPLELSVQAEFLEPRIRINTEPIDTQALHWQESTAWDELAEYYSPTAVTAT